MTEEIKKILQDLYEIDPKFREHEGELIVLIQNLLSSRPDAKIDEAFVAQLRQKLLAKADIMKEQPAKQTFMARFWPVGVAAAVLVVAVLVTNQQTSTQVKQDNKILSLLSSDVKINKLSSNAFGKISQQYAAGGMGGGSGLATGRGGGGGESLATPSAPTATPAPDAKMIAPGGMGGGAGFVPPIYNYKYKYTGGEFAVPDTATVYKKVTNGLGGAAATDVLKSLNFGLVDTNTFSNLSVQSFSIQENRDFGYILSIDMVGGGVNISQNWQRWPDPNRSCSTNDCYEQNRIKYSDVPANDELISIANQFLKDHNIPTSHYGEPVVQDSWKRQYETFADKSQFYVPESEAVIYPLVLDGKTVYDESGNPSGLYVDVNVRHKKVANVMQLSVLNFDSSDYSTITNKEALIASAEKGGYHGVYYYSDTANAQNETVDLGTPTVQLVQVWQYKDGQSSQLYVPFLVFPVTNHPKGEYFYQQNVIVPLVEGLLDTPTGGPIRIMPAEPKG